MNFNQMDYQLFHAMNEWGRTASFLNPVMRLLANDAFYLFFIGLLVYWFIRNENNRKMVAESVIAACAGLTISWILGHLFYRDRPFVSHTVLQLIDHPANASFPSDHALGAFVIAAAIAMYRKKDGMIWLILAALIAFSRVWTGVHYPTDVLAGALIGILVAAGVHWAISHSFTLSRWLQACIQFYEKYETKIWPQHSKNEPRATAQEKRL
ncbi:phosphatase PAP2 family protein [Paenibacillus sp. HJL G12]|uniref:Phosphatase PAP2 family protein n=1 Tax=Paenibacillus dendrobii TaxID=2691084 RepID=A0A7X3II63_9BACL|nr:undecaprenyl-diphosphatase [Paenibacillus dendrobii]MWV42975.1 phosphatase PAP2 family protein [Paenibacillus dendrobii]